MCEYVCCLWCGVMCCVGDQNSALIYTVPNLMGASTSTALIDHFLATHGQSRFFFGVDQKLALAVPPESHSCHTITRTHTCTRTSTRKHMHTQTCTHTWSGCLQRLKTAELHAEDKGAAPRHKESVSVIVLGWFLAACSPLLGPQCPRVGAGAVASVSLSLPMAGRLPC